MYFSFIFDVFLKELIAKKCNKNAYDKQFKKLYFRCCNVHSIYSNVYYITKSFRLQYDSALKPTFLVIKSDVQLPKMLVSLPIWNESYYNENFLFPKRIVPFQKEQLVSYLFPNGTYSEYFYQFSYLLLEPRRKEKRDQIIIINIILLY